MDFQTKKENFEISTLEYNGPLDTLCFLINKKRLDINNLDISELSDQYTAFINKKINNANVSELGDHLRMAAYLVELKIRIQLSINNKIDDKILEQERDDLMDRLIEYQAYQRIATHLEKRFLFRQTMYDIPDVNLDEFQQKEVVYEEVEENLDVLILKNTMERLLYEYELRNHQNIEVDIKEYDVNYLKTILIEYLKKQDNNQSLIFEYFIHQKPQNQNKSFLAMSFLVILVLIKETVLKYELKENDYLLKLDLDNLKVFEAKVFDIDNLINSSSSHEQENINKMFGDING